MYVQGNPKTKKEFRAMIDKGRAFLFSPGLGAPVLDGEEYVEGPHFPQPHRWYAKVRVRKGVVVKILS